MTILKICIVAIAGVILSAIIKNNAPAYGTLVQISLVVVIVITAIPDIKILLSALENIKNAENFSAEGLYVMLKVFSVLAVGSVCSDICRDNGEGAVAGVVELSSKLTAFVCALPVLTAVVSLATSFLNG